MAHIADWQIESFRLTLFPNMEEKAAWASLWPTNISIEPNSRIERPSAKVIIEEAIWNDRKLNVSCQPDRADIMLSAGEPEIFGIPSAGSFDEVLDIFKTIIPLETGRNLSRIAFGATLLMRKDSHETAYQTISEYLPSVKVDIKSRDFFYQINRPTTSSYDNITLNRLSQWAVVRMRQVLIAPGSTSAFDDIFACRLQLDCNTDAENSLPYKSSFPKELFFELVGQAREIAEKGDLS